METEWWIAKIETQGYRIQYFLEGWFHDMMEPYPTPMLYHVMVFRRLVDTKTILLFGEEQLIVCPRNMLLSTPVLMYGGLISIAFCLSVTPLKSTLENNSYLRKYRC